jgi:hypothetical protein
MRTRTKRRILKTMMLRRRKRKRRQAHLSLRQLRRLSVAKRIFLAFDLHTL